MIKPGSAGVSPALIKSLFCLVDGAVSGGNKVFLELARDLSADGQVVDLYFWQSGPAPFLSPGKANLSSALTIEEAVSAEYDVIYFSHSFLLPLALPFMKHGRSVWVCQGYETFYRGDTYAESLTDSRALAEVLQYPTAMISVSKSIQKLVKERSGRDSYLVPVAIDRSLFKQRQNADPEAPVKRILLVGNYLSPWKGLTDAFKAVKLLAADMNVELVLITQEDRRRHIVNELGIPIEIHYCPQLSDIPAIYASCHVYCCASWYEGIGLPKLEAFACGVPVVSTRDFGVCDFGIDGENVLLCEPNNPFDLSEKLRKILTDQLLAARLSAAGLRTVADFDWPKTVTAFQEVQKIILQNPSETRTYSAASMHVYSDRLEEEGLFGPQSAYDSMAKLGRRFFVLCEQLLEENLTVQEGVEHLAELSEELAPFSSNPNRQYYNDFKASYNACRLLVSLKDQPEFLNYVRAMTVPAKSAHLD